MANIVTGEEELVEVTASIVLVMPPGVTFAGALREAILLQAWASAYPDLAQELCDYVLNDPALKESLRGYPSQVSEDMLMAKVEELINQFWDSTSLRSRLLAAGLLGGQGDFWQKVWEVISSWFPETDQPGGQVNRGVIEDIFFTQVIYEDDVQNALANCVDDPSLEALIDLVLAKIEPYIQSLPEDEFDFSRLTADIPTLYKLLSWNPVAEQLLINELEKNLKKLETPMHIGEQIVPVPFLDQFKVFLTRMEERQSDLGQLWVDYFGEGDEGKEKRAKIFKWLNEHIFSQENVEAAFQLYLDSLKGSPLGLAIDLTQLGWENLVEPAIGEDAANSILATLATKVYAVSQVGTNLQGALIADPKNALAGIAVGMFEASPLGFFLDISTAYVSNSFEKYNTEYGAHLPTYKPGWWKDMLGIDTANPAYQVGEAAGVVGMTVSNLVVNIASVPSSASMGGSMGAVPAGSSVLAWSNGVMTLALAQELGLVVGTVGAAQGGYQTGQFFANQEDEESEEPDELEVLRRHRRSGNRQVKKDDQVWNLPAGKDANAIPESDPIGDELQRVATEKAAAWGPDKLTPAQENAIEEAVDAGDLVWANVLEGRYRGSWVEKQIRQEFPQLQWSREGVDAFDPETGIWYEICSGTQDNMDRHARRMPDLLFRMITF